MTVKELTSKRAALDKAGVDLAMKAVYNFEGKNKKAKKSKKAKSSKTKGAPKSKETIDIRPDADGSLPSEEELEEMIRKFTEQAGSEGAKAEALPQAPKEEKKIGGEEDKPAEDGAAGEKHDEL